jgi:hypothetical protein
MKKFFLAAAFTAVFAAGALAEDNRDQAFGKHDMGPGHGNNTMNRPHSASGTTTGMATTKSATSRATKHSKKMDE